MPRKYAILTLVIAPWLVLMPGADAATIQPETPEAAETDPGEAPSETARLPESSDSRPDAQTLAAIVEDADRPLGERLEAATALVALGRAREALLAINAILGQGDGDASGAKVLLEAMARTPVAPRELWAPVSLVPRDDPSVRALVASAAGSFRTRQAADMLVTLLHDDPDASVRRAAHRALIRLSGRSLPPDAGAWGSWLERQGAVDGVAWLGGLIEGLASRADELERRAQTAESHLTDAYRRLHLALAPEARSDLLATMLHEQIPTVRALAFDLIDRELASSLQLGPEVGEAAVELMGDPDAMIRRRAAALVVRLAPETGAPAIIERLRVERDPSVAAPLLRGVTRWPAESASAHVVRWAAGRSPAADVALEAAWSLARAGVLASGAQRDDLLTSLREREATALSVHALRLLVTLGEERDRVRARELLASDDPELRRRVADALVSDPGSCDAIVEAAATDLRLYDAARRAIAAREPTAESLRALCALPAPSPEARRAAILEVCARMAEPELVQGVAELGDPVLIERALSRLEQRAPADASPATGALGAGLVHLAVARLKLGRPGDALATLDRVGVVGDDDELARAADETRVSCLLAAGRVEDASVLGAGADAWLRGLELSIGTPHARWVHDELTVRFAGALDEARSARLVALRTRLGEGQPEPMPSDDP